MAAKKYSLHCRHKLRAGNVAVNNIVDTQRHPRSRCETNFNDLYLKRTLDLAYVPERESKAVRFLDVSLYQLRIKNMAENTVPLLRKSVARSSSVADSSDSFREEYHDANIPDHAEHALHAIYGNVYSSMHHFRIHGGLDGASTFVLRREDEIVAVFLFISEGNRVRVLNEGMDVNQAALTQFAKFIFQHFQGTDFISFNGVAHSIKQLNFPYSECFCTDDSVITLPSSNEGYLNSLGKATRKNIKQSLNRLQRDHPTFAFQVHDGATVDESLIRNIISFNRQRFAKKGKASGITASDEGSIIRMIRACGIVGSITIDGKLCGGSLVYCIGEHYHSWLKAHDPAYDDYRLGLVGSFMMISECIRRGGKTFHLMWGREPHKALLNSELKILSNLTIYRNHAAALRNCGVMFKQLYQHGMHQGKLWLLDAEKRPGGIAIPIKAGLNGIRKIRTLLH